MRLLNHSRGMQFLAVCSALLATQSAHASDFQLGAPTVVGTGDYVYDSVTFDLDGDGDLDVAVASPASTLYLRINQGDGTFVAGPEYPLPDWGQAVDAGDVNGDGILDLVVASYHFGHFLTTFLGDGQGGFVPGVDQIITGIPIDLVLGDLNGDGLLDVALTLWGVPGGGWTILHGDGAGSFAPQIDFILDLNCFGAELVDIDADGDTDSLVTSYTPGSILVFENDGAGNFTSEEYFMGNGCWSVLAVDLNADGVLDLLSTNRNTGTISSRLGDGAGGFGNLIQPGSLSGYAFESVAADLDGDGDLDVATLRIDGLLRIYAGDGTGYFVLDSLKNLHGNAGNIQAGDFDLDGDVDLLGLTTTAELVAVFNHTPQENPFLLRTNHLLAGGTAELDVRHGTPGGLALLLVSLAGTGPGIHVPFLDTTTDLLSPRRPAPPQVMGTTGTATFAFHLPTALLGMPVWFQALEFQGASNVVSSQVH